MIFLRWHRKRPNNAICATGSMGTCPRWSASNSTTPAYCVGRSTRTMADSHSCWTVLICCSGFTCLQTVESWRINLGHMEWLWIYHQACTIHSDWQLWASANCCRSWHVAGSCKAASSRRSVPTASHQVASGVPWLWSLGTMGMQRQWYGRPDCYVCPSFAFRCTCGAAGSQAQVCTRQGGMLPCAPAHYQSGKAFSCTERRDNAHRPSTWRWSFSRYWLACGCISSSGSSPQKVAIWWNPKGPCMVQMGPRPSSRSQMDQLVRDAFYISTSCTGVGNWEYVFTQHMEDLFSDVWIWLQTGVPILGGIHVTDHQTYSSRISSWAQQAFQQPFHMLAHGCPYADVSPSGVSSTWVAGEQAWQCTGRQGNCTSKAASSNDDNGGSRKRCYAWATQVLVNAQ